MLANPFQRLADDDLDTSLLQIARRERELGADVILQLMVVSERRLYAEHGYESLFAYAVGRLGFSRSTAYRRKVVVDAAREFPEIIVRLRDGRLQLCAAAAVATHLTRDNVDELLDAVVGLSHREVEAVVAKRFRPSPVAVVDDAPLSACFSVGTQVTETEPEVEVMNEPAPQRTVVKPVGRKASRVSVTLREETLALLERAREVVRAEADDELLRKALELLLDKHDALRRVARREKRSMKKVAKRTQPKPESRTGSIAERDEAMEAKRPAPKTQSRTGSLAERDEAMARANGRCEYTSKAGHRCRSRRYLDNHHVQPYAMGGPSIAANFQVLCTTHHRMITERVFGSSSAQPRRAARRDPAAGSSTS